MASKKRAITGLARPKGFADDAAEMIGKSVVRNTKKAVKKKVSKAVSDVVDPKFRGKVYDSKGGLSKQYKDYVMRNMKGQF